MAVWPQNNSWKSCRTSEETPPSDVTGLNQTTFREHAPNQMANNLNMLQEMAMLAWMVKGDIVRPGVEAVTLAQLVLEIWNRLTKRDEIGGLREVALLSIVDYIKRNPEAGDDALCEEVARQVSVFAAKVSTL